MLSSRRKAERTFFAQSAGAPASGVALFVAIWGGLGVDATKMLSKTSSHGIDTILNDQLYVIEQPVHGWSAAGRVIECGTHSNMTVRPMHQVVAAQQRAAGAHRPALQQLNRHKWQAARKIAKARGCDGGRPRRTPAAAFGMTATPVLGMLITLVTTEFLNHR